MTLIETSCQISDLPNRKSLASHQGGIYLSICCGERADGDKHGDTGVSISLQDNIPEAQLEYMAAPLKSFMTYDIYLISANRYKEDFIKDSGAVLTSQTSSVTTLCPKL